LTVIVILMGLARQRQRHKVFAGRGTRNASQVAEIKHLIIS